MSAVNVTGASLCKTEHGVAAASPPTANSNEIKHTAKTLYSTIYV